MAIIKRISRFFVVNQPREKKIAEDYRDSIRIKTPDIYQKTRGTFPAATSKR